MKKLFVLFTGMLMLVATASAQIVTAMKADKLKTEVKKKFPPNAPKQAPGQNRVSAAGQSNYWSTAKSYYDDGGYFSYDNGQDLSFPTKVDIVGDQASITGLMGLKTLYGDMCTTEYTLTGTYDEAAGTITIPVKPYYNGMKRMDCTVLGEFMLTSTGQELYGVLVVGNMTKDGSVNPQENLIFDVSADKTRIMSRTGFGCYCVDMMTNQGVAFIDYFKTMSTEQMTEQPSFSASPSTISFGDQYICKGMTLTTGFYLTNTSLTSTNVNIASTDPALSLSIGYTSSKLSETTTWIKSGEQIPVNVYFTPTTEGSYTGLINITADGMEQPVTVKVVANVQKDPVSDYTKIVGKGEFEFLPLNTDHPWVVTDTINGFSFPVAVTTCSKDYTSSVMTAKFSVPEGQMGILSWKGHNQSSSPNGLFVHMNGKTIYTNTEKAEMNEYFPLTPGTYTIDFTYYLDADWYDAGYIGYKLKAWIYDLSIDNQAVTPQRAVLDYDKIDFGRHYIDRFEICDSSQVVNLFNAGTDELRVTGIDGENGFSGIIPSNGAASTEKLPVILTFTASKTGQYEGKVTIHTTAGDFVVNCAASTEKIPTDFNAIVTGGEFSFDTDLRNPFVVDGDVAYNSTSKKPLVDGDTGLSWLKAEFIVPEGQDGTLSWTAENSSNDFFNIMDEQALTDGTEIVIDGKLVEQYAGESDASSTTVPANLLRFAPGKHNIIFRYIKKSRTAVREDWVKVSKLKLELSGLPDNKAEIDTKTIEFPTVRQGFKSYAKINLRNEGLNPLKVTGFTSDNGLFGMMETDAEAATFDVLPVKIYADPKSDGTYSGTLTLHTTAGDFLISCSGTCEKLDGTPLLVEDFETGHMDWTTAEGSEDDGFNWVEAWQWSSAGAPMAEAHSGDVCMVSISWEMKEMKRYYPDNYLISPEIAIPAEGKTTLSYFVFPKDAGGECLESLEVLAGEGTDPMTFTRLSDELFPLTMDWEERTVDLSQYAGKTIRVAFRHYESDMWILLDDVMVYNDALFSGIANVDAGATGDTEWFSVDGVKLQKPQKGVNIMKTRRADGKIMERKVVMK